jgi:hypothetical protein
VAGGPADGSGGATPIESSTTGAFANGSSAFFVVGACATGVVRETVSVTTGTVRCGAADGRDRVGVVEAARRSLVARAGVRWIGVTVVVVVAAVRGVAFGTASEGNAIEARASLGRGADSARTTGA